MDDDKLEPRTKPEDTSCSCVPIRLQCSSSKICDCVYRVQRTYNIIQYYILVICNNVLFDKHNVHTRNSILFRLKSKQLFSQYNIIIVYILSSDKFECRLLQRYYIFTCDIYHLSLSNILLYDINLEHFYDNVKYINFMFNLSLFRYACCII